MTKTYYHGTVSANRSSIEKLGLNVLFQFGDGLCLDRENDRMIRRDFKDNTEALAGIHLCNTYEEAKMFAEILASERNKEDGLLDDLQPLIVEVKLDDCNKSIVPYQGYYLHPETIDPSCISEYFYPAVTSVSCEDAQLQSSTCQVGEKRKPGKPMTIDLGLASGFSKRKKESPTDIRNQPFIEGDITPAPVAFSFLGDHSFSNDKFDTVLTDSDIEAMLNDQLAADGC